MSNEKEPAEKLDIVPRLMDLGLPRLARQLRSFVKYERYAPQTKGADRDWTSYAAQRHVRGLALNPGRNQLWLATWGGLLCWLMDAGICIRHTSEHGLIGNAVRDVKVDANGIVWASGQQHGLCTLLPEDKGLWKHHEELLSWTVLCMYGAEKGGVYLVLRDDRGQSALGRIAPLRDSPLLILARGGLALKNVEALLLSDAETVWTGNAWGLHRYREGGGFDSFDVKGARVCALAKGVGESLWLGTSQGVFRFNTVDESVEQKSGWPLDHVVSVAFEPDTGNVWVATVREMGRIRDNVWRAVCCSPPEVNVLLSADAGAAVAAADKNYQARSDRIWAGGTHGLYDVDVENYEEVLRTDEEEMLFSGVQCLHAGDAEIFAGTASGLYRFDGNSWSNYTARVRDLRDLRAIVAGPTEQQILVGAWQGGLLTLGADEDSHCPSLKVPVVSLTGGEDGKLWAATVDAIYLLDKGCAEWQLITRPDGSVLSGRIIQRLCYQSRKGEKKGTGSTLWVGTSEGLYGYRPGLDLGDWVQGELEHLSINALALNPLDNRLWVGTPAGLFSEPEWMCHKEGNVRALAFSQAGDLWVGTDAGLERWPAPGEVKGPLDNPISRFDTLSSGMASDVVNALVVRGAGGSLEVWAGGPAGVSRHKYQSKD